MDGCHGGDAGIANKWMAENGITDETCSIYQARGDEIFFEYWKIFSLFQAMTTVLPAPRCPHVRRVGQTPDVIVLQNTSPTTWTSSGTWRGTTRRRP